MRSTTHGLVMKKTICRRAPQVQRRRSIANTFFRRRPDELLGLLPVTGK
jgi:hypothetical protein